LAFLFSPKLTALARLARNRYAARLHYRLGLSRLVSAADPRSRLLLRDRHDLPRGVRLPAWRRHPLQYFAWRAAFPARQAALRQRWPWLARHCRERVPPGAGAGLFHLGHTYYLTLLSAFLLKGLGIEDPLASKLVTTAILLGIGVQGLLRGLHGLENIEEYAVGLKLAIIAAALAALAWFNIDAALNGTWHLVEQTKPFDWQSARVVLGLLVVVQGFETSRFLAGAYPPELRVRTMRYAQWLSGGIYITFFLLAMAAVDDPKALNGNATGIIAVLEPAASSLVFLIVIGAVFAQLSAAVADSIGAGGLIEQVSGRRIDHRHAYPVIALIGIALTWTLDIFAVITLASRAFALFYLLQCLVAAGVALRTPGLRRHRLHAAGFLALAAMALAVVLFGIPMEGI
jgi:hypothetical protein